MFDPKAQPRLIKAIRPYRPRNRLFEPKELSVRILTVLREAQGEPLTLDAIAERIVGDKGLGAAAAPMVRPIAAIALLALKKRGIVAGDGTPTCGVNWRPAARPVPTLNSIRLNDALPHGRHAQTELVGAMLGSRLSEALDRNSRSPSPAQCAAAKSPNRSLSTILIA